MKHINHSRNFKLSTLSIAIIMLASQSTQAVYNLYNKEGLSFDIHGQLDMQAYKDDTALVLQKDAAQFHKEGDDYKTHYAKGEKFDNSSDKRTRIGQEHGVSYIDFRAAQKLPDDWRVTGNIGLGYSANSDAYLSNTSLSIDKKNIGAVTLGRQYLHNAYVARTGTGTPLDIFSTSAIRADYYAKNNLHASAYYSLAGSSDVRKDSPDIKDGYGASLGYTIPYNNAKLRLGAGYSNNSANPTEQTADHQGKKTNAYAGSAEYRTNKWLVAADIGQKNEKMSEHTPLERVKTQYLGAKIGYDINPVFRLSAGYGVQKADKSLKQGELIESSIRSAANSWQDYQEKSGPDKKAWTDADLQKHFKLTDAQLQSYIESNNENYPYNINHVAANNRDLFHKIDKKQYYVQADYRFRPNVRAYVRFDKEEVKNILNGETFSKAHDTGYRTGVVLSF